MGLQIARKTGQELELTCGTNVIRVLVVGRSTKLEIIAPQQVKIRRPKDAKAKTRPF